MAQSLSGAQWSPNALAGAVGTSTNDAAAALRCTA
jgi:hypothetical protein